MRWHGQTNHQPSAEHPLLIRGALPWRQGRNLWRELQGLFPRRIKQRLECIYSRFVFFSLKHFIAMEFPKDEKKKLVWRNDFVRTQIDCKIYLGPKFCQIFQQLIDFSMIILWSIFYISYPLLKIVCAGGGGGGGDGGGVYHHPSGFTPVVKLCVLPL